MAELKTTGAAPDSKEARATWGRWLAAEMKRLGLSVRDVARLSDYADGSVEMYLAHYSTGVCRQKIARALSDYERGLKAVAK